MCLLRHNEVGVEQTVMLGIADFKAIVNAVTSLAVVSENAIFKVCVFVVISICVLHYSNLFFEFIYCNSSASDNQSFCNFVLETALGTCFIAGAPTVVFFSVY